MRAPRPAPSGLVPTAVWSWLSLAVPAGARCFSDLGPWFVSLSFVGHVGATPLAALSLTETWLYAWMSVAWDASAAAQSTLVSQAHGARSVRAIRGWSAMSAIASMCLAAAVALAWVVSRAGLDALGFDAALTRAGAAYTAAALPVLFVEGVVNLTIATHLTALQFAAVPLAVGLCTLLVDAVLTYGLIFGIPGVVARLDDPLRGSARAWVIASVVAAALNAGALRSSWNRELANEPPEGGMEWEGAALVRGEMGTSDSLNARLVSGSDVDDDDKDTAAAAAAAAASAASTATPATAAATSITTWLTSREHWRAYLEQLVPNLFTFSLSCGQFACISFLAASLGPAAIAAHNTSLCVFELLFSVAKGLGEATSILVGSHLGRGDDDAARRTVRVAFSAAAVWGVAVGCAGFAWHSSIMTLFSTDEAILAQCASIAAVLWPGYAALCVGQVGLSVLEGQGRATEQTGAYLISMTVGVALAVASSKCTRLGLAGLWGSLLLSYVLLDVCAVVCVARSNWEALKALAHERSAGADAGVGAGADADVDLGTDG